MPQFRARAEDIGRLKVRSANGEMIPLAAVLNVKSSAGPERAMRYNGFLSADVNGGAAPGYSTGQAQDAVARIAAETLPKGFNFEWTELTYQQILAGNSSLVVFPLAILLVFLVLAALYESLALPIAIILIVPLGLLAALFGVWLSNGDNNVFTQIGLIVLVGLSAKNAILIVEFARELEFAGRNPVQAAIEASRLRLRPILMTSLAFIMGVLPLVLSTGAGAEMRYAMGVAVFSGMIGVTLFGLALTPVFYVLMRRLSGNRPLTSTETRRKAPTRRRHCPPPSERQYVRRSARRRGVFQQALGVASEELGDIGRAVEAADAGGTFVIRHVERIVAAIEHAVRAGRPHQEIERGVIVRDRVVVEPRQGFFRRTLQPHTRLLAHIPAVAEATQLIGHEAAAMDEAERDVREPLHDAAEHERCSGDRRLERVSDQVLEEIGFEPFAGRDPVRMDKHESVELVRDSPDFIERRIVEIAPVDIRTDMQSAKAALRHRAPEFNGGLCGRLHGDGGEPEKAVRIGGHERADRIVLHDRYVVRQLGIRLVEKCVRDIADDLQVHSPRIEFAGTAAPDPRRTGETDSARCRRSSARLRRRRAGSAKRSGSALPSG